MSSLDRYAPPYPIAAAPYAAGEMPLGGLRASKPRRSSTIIPAVLALGAERGKRPTEILAGPIGRGVDGVRVGTQARRLRWCAPPFTTNGGPGLSALTITLPEPAIGNRLPPRGWELRRVTPLRRRLVWGTRSPTQASEPMVLASGHALSGRMNGLTPWPTTAVVTIAGS